MEQEAPPESDLIQFIVNDCPVGPATPGDAPPVVDPQTIARSRHAVLRACEAWGIEDTAAAELVASELVANAVMHGWGRVDLRLRDTGDGLRIEVEEANPSPPVVREGRVGRVGGFGLHIVSRLAEWGWRPTPNGKVVWARVRAKEPWAREEK